MTIDALFLIAMPFMIECGNPSFSLSSPITPECNFFPDGERLHSMGPPSLLSAETPTITILASDLATERHRIERQECNLLIIQNRKNPKSFAFEINAAAGTVATYFSSVDTAFAHCLEFLEHMNDPGEWDKDWHLMQFIRFLNNAVDHMPERAEIVKVFRSTQDRNQNGKAWGFIRHVGFGVHRARPVDTPIPAKIRCKVRQIVVEIWGGAFGVFFRGKMNELTALINHPMLAFLEGRLPPGITETLRRMDNIGQSPIRRDRDSRLVLEALIRDWAYLTKFKGDLDALRMVYDWKQENNEGHVVVNLLHGCDGGDDAFDLMRTALISMGWDHNAIVIAKDKIDH